MTRDAINNHNIIRIDYNSVNDTKKILKFAFITSYPLIVSDVNKYSETLTDFSIKRHCNYRI